MYIYSDSFGDKQDPTILLNAGAGNQSISWPDNFCQKLSQKSYFVIRYDYRDCGLSSEINYDKNPYTVLDLAEDTIGLLNEYQIEKAHFMGFSMGGQLAQFVGAYKPQRVLSLILLGTSTDFQPGFDAFSGIYHPTGLSAPDKNYITWATRKIDPSQESLDKKIQDYIHTWRLLDGNPDDFDLPFYEKQAYQTLTRTKLQTPYVNHAKAMQASYRLHKEAPAKILDPTLIIQGGKDPVFPPDHGEDLHNKIKNSKLLIFNDFAHAISPRNFEKIIDATDCFIRARPL